MLTDPIQIKTEIQLYKEKIADAKYDDKYYEERNSSEFKFSVQDLDL